VQSYQYARLLDLIHYPATSAYDGTLIVQRSIDLGTPIIFVSMNYRLSGLGFLASKEVNAAGIGNLGLHDRKFLFSNFGLLPKPVLG